MAEPKPRIAIQPRSAMTHQELLIDFVDLAPNRDFAVNLKGPIAPYWATLKSDPTGRAQLFWRTQAPGEYTITAKGDDIKLSETFSVRRQAGELVDEHPYVNAGVQTVEEPGRMGDVSSTELRADPYDESLDRPEQVDPAYEPAPGPTQTEDDDKPKTTRKGK